MQFFSSTKWGGGEGGPVLLAYCILWLLWNDSMPNYWMIWGLKWSSGSEFHNQNKIYQVIVSSGLGSFPGWNVWFLVLIDMKGPIAWTPLEVWCEKLIIRIPSKISLLSVGLGLLQVDRDGVLHDVDHLGVGDLAVDLHHGDGVTLVLCAGVGAHHCRQQKRHQRSVSLEIKK